MMTVVGAVLLPLLPMVIFCCKAIIGGFLFRMGWEAAGEQIIEDKGR